MVNVDKSRAFFLTVHFQNISNMGFADYLDDTGFPLDKTGENLVTAICEKFVNSGKTERYCSGCACVSAKDRFHLHLAIYVPTMISFNGVRKFFGNAHVELQNGTKEQLQDYILKKGKWAEKGETVLYITPDMDGVVGKQGRRSDIHQIEQLIEDGLTPREIFALSFSYRKYEKMIKDAYYDKRFKETPFFREIKVYWHVGDSGSGKSWTAKQIIDEHGEDYMYFLTDYQNGGFDKYNGEEILFMDEFRGQIPYSTLLGILQGYKNQVHSRYSNICGLWNEVHITSVFPPELVYKNMVQENRDVDTLKQLMRRLTSIIYHWTENGTRKSYVMPADRYRDYENLKYIATLVDEDGFLKAPDDADLPFN